MRGENGFPFRIKSGTKPTSCSTCGDVLRCLGTCAFEWQTMEGNGPRLTSVATDGNVLWGLCANGTPYRHIKGTWERVGDYSASWEHLEQIAVIGEDLWAVDSNGFLRRRGNPATSPEITSWTRISAHPSNSRLKHISVTDGGLAVWCTDETWRVHVYLAEEARWLCLPGRLGQVSVSTDGMHVWGVDPITDAVFYRNGLNGCWEHVRGKLQRVLSLIHI